MIGAMAEGWKRWVGAPAWRWIAAELGAEREQWASWAPVAIGIGVALYFALPTEPAWWAVTGAALVMTVATIALRQHPRLFAGGLILLAMLSGLAAGAIRTAWVAAPMLAQKIGPVEVSGAVLEVELLPSGARLLLGDLSIEDRALEQLPERVRIKVSKLDVPVVPGALVVLLAELQPPSAPVAPGAYDFQRDAYFRSIGAIGFSYGAPRSVTPAATIGGWSQFWAELRLKVTSRVLAALPDRSGAVAAALMTGSQTAIAKPVLTAMRDSGLAHLLSISGLHVGLLAAIMFGFIRGGLALIPRLALRFPIKKWAAIAALIATFLYMMLAGAPVPTQRAFLMTGLVLVAVLADRVAISMRLVAWAACLILLIRPEALVGPSFQMSFAAVMALVAAFEGTRAWRASQRAEAGWLRRASLYFGGLAAMSLVAGLATAPYAIYHFNRFADYSILANMIAVPLTGFVVMPMAVVAFMAMPFGLEAYPLAIMGWGCEAIIRVAEWVSAWPGAVATIPAMPLAGLMIATLGGLWLCLWNRPWRYAGVVLIALGMASPLGVRPPDILVSADADLVGLTDENGDLMLSNPRARGLEAETWLRRAGLREAASWPEDGPADGNLRDRLLACDSLGCIYRREGWTVAIAWKAEALEEDCTAASLVISLEPIERDCPSAEATVDRFDLWREGAHAVWLDDGSFRLRSARDGRGERPWVVRPEAAREARP